MLQFRQEKFRFAVIVVQVMRGGFGKLLVFKHRKIERAAVFGEIDLQGVVDAEIVPQVFVDLPTELEVPCLGNDTGQPGVFKKIFYQLILIQLEL
jgi:hypothetical protein